MSLTAVLEANGIYTKPDSRWAYLLLTSTNDGLNLVERQVAQEVAKRVSKERMIKIILSEEKNLRKHPVFLTDINLATRADANDIIKALKATQKLFEDSIKLLAEKAVQEAIESNLLKQS